MDDAVDGTFGIRYQNDKFVIGDQIIKIQGDNIALDDEVYVGTPSLWALITDRNPKEYTQENYERCKEPLYATNVIYRDYDPGRSYPRANRSKKWNKILRSIWEDFQ